MKTHLSLPRLFFALLTLALMGFPAQAEPVSVQTIAETWDVYGKGVVRFQNRMLYMKEAPDSGGLMVVSPERYGENVTLRYELMPMNAASVCVAILAASDGGEGAALTLPEEYDGSMGPWTGEIHNYFFAFHNMAHDRTPFAVRFPQGAAIGEHERNVMRSGAFHTIEIVKAGGKLTLWVDGVRLFEGEDQDPLGGGHIAFRIRGINGEAASCLIRNVTIENG